MTKDISNGKKGGEINPKELLKGIEVEKEHEDLFLELESRLKEKNIPMIISGEDFYKRIAEAHLEEIPNYYTLLDEMEEEAKSNMTTRFNTHKIVILKRKINEFERYTTDELINLLPDFNKYTSLYMEYKKDLEAYRKDNIEGFKSQIESLENPTPVMEDGGAVGSSEKESVKQRVEKRLKEAQSKKEFKDTEIVTYTKKYRRSYDVVSVNELDELELDQVNAYKQVIKDKVWKAYDAQEQKEKGYSSGATFLKVQCRKSLQKRPFDSKDAREVYVKNIDKLQTILNACFTTKEVEVALYKFISDDDFYLGSEDVTRYHRSKKKDTIFGKKFTNFCGKWSSSASNSFLEAYSYDPYTKEQQDEYVLKRLESIASSIGREQEVVEQAKEDSEDDEKVISKLSYIYSTSSREMRKGLTEDPQKYRDVYVNLFERRLKNLINQQESLNDREKLPVINTVRVENWDWAFKEKEKKEKKKTTSVKVNTKPPLSHISRVGGYEIPLVSVEKITKELCFNNVVFGNALKDDFSKESVKHFLGAITDLSEIIDVEICKINELGKLDINFATMGTGGHSATYFPSYKAINLTKSKGDGSVAHEWFHYLDNVIQEGSYRKGTPVLASEVANSRDIGVKATIYQLVKYIKNGDLETNETIIKTFPAQSKVKYHAYGDTLEESITKIQRMYPIYSKSDQSKSKSTVNYYGFLAHKFGKDFIDVPMKLTTTRYYYNSSRMGSDYWVRSVELLARAFEAYIEQKLTAKDRQNNYLVSYDWAKKYSDDMPYPSGKELERISALFDSLIGEFKKEYQVGDFIPFTDKRTSEYIELDKSKEAKKEPLKEELNPEKFFEHAEKVSLKITGLENKVKVISAAAGYKKQHTAKGWALDLKKLRLLKDTLIAFGLSVKGETIPERLQWVKTKKDIEDLLRSIITGGEIGTLDVDYKFAKSVDLYERANIKEGADFEIMNIYSSLMILRDKEEQNIKAFNKKDTCETPSRNSDDYYNSEYWVEYLRCATKENISFAAFKRSLESETSGDKFSYYFDGNIIEEHNGVDFNNVGIRGFYNKWQEGEVELPSKKEEVGSSGKELSLKYLLEKIGGRIWEKGDKKRLYIDRGYSTKKMKTTTYIYIKDGKYLVSCYIDCPSQPFQWIIKEQEMIVERVYDDIKEFTQELVYVVVNKDTSSYVDHNARDCDKDDAEYFIKKQDAIDFIDDYNCKTHEIKKVNNPNLKDKEKPKEKNRTKTRQKALLTKRIKALKASLSILSGEKKAKVEKRIKALELTNK